MAYEYLNETTYTNQLRDQEQMLQLLEEKGFNDNAYSESDAGDSDLIEIYDKETANEETENHEDEAPEQEESSDPDLEMDAPEFDDTDNELLAFLFAGDDDANTSSPYSGSRSNGGAGVNPNVNTFLSDMTQKYSAGNLGIWGDARHQIRKSDHNTGDAVDLSFNNDETKRQSIVADAIKNPSTKYVISNNKIWQNGSWKDYTGDNPHTGHVHVSMNRQNGGLVAETESELRRGLNDNNYDHAELKLKGENTIRGLDNFQPVAVTDGSKYKILTGPQDTAQFNGNVYEKKL